MLGDFIPHHGRPRPKRHVVQECAMQPACNDVWDEEQWLKLSLKRGKINFLWEDMRYARLALHEHHYLFMNLSLNSQNHFLKKLHATKPENATLRRIAQCDLQWMKRCVRVTGCGLMSFFVRTDTQEICTTFQPNMDNLNLREVKWTCGWLHLFQNNYLTFKIACSIPYGKTCYKKTRPFHQ